MPINSLPINSEPINGVGEITEGIRSTYVGTMLGLRQVVRNYFPIRQMLAIEQIVKHKAASAGLMLSLQQKVVNQYSGQVLGIQQSVFSNVEFNYLSQFGFYPVVVIGGAVIPAQLLSDGFTIERKENESAQATLSIAETAGAINIYRFANQPIQIFLLGPNNTSPLMYTGKVNIPTFDFVKRRTRLTCSDLREENIAKLAGIIPSLGFYLEEVFGAASGLSDELEKRLSTTTLAVDFAANGQYFITDLMPKSSPDITLTDSQLYRGDGRYPVVDLNIRGRIINTVNIGLTYQFTRLYQREVNYTWSPEYGSTCEFLTKGYSICAKSTILGAINGTGWQLKNIGFTPVLDEGWYKCNGQLYGWVNNTLNPSDVANQTDSLGNNITDASGNNLTSGESAPSPNISSHFYCFGSSWTIATRFAQNRQEQYSLVVTNPSSVAQYGQVAKAENATIAGTYDSTSWETFTNYQSPNVEQWEHRGVDWYFDSDLLYDRQKLIIAFQLLVLKARADILKSHRTCTCTFQIPLNPYIELYQTIRVNSALSVNGGSLDVRGKVVSIKHQVTYENPFAAYTEIQIAFSKCISPGFDTPILMPTLTQDNYTSPVTAIPLGSVYGIERPVNFYGFNGNKFIKTVRTDRTTDWRRTSFQEEFMIKTPNIEEAVRNTKTNYGVGTYYVTIPDTLLSLTYGNN